MKKSKSKTFSRIATAYHQLKAGGRPRVTGDGSIPTHPVVPVAALSEGDVQELCMDWLKRHRVYGDRNNVGKGTLGKGGFYTFGIVGGGDWIGLLPTGIHIEIEFKKGIGGRQSKIQQERQAKIRGNNGIYLIIHGLPELEFLMKGVL